MAKQDGPAGSNPNPSSDKSATQAVAFTGDSWGDKMIRTCWRKPPADLGERARRRVSLHLIPFLFFLYILAYLDRVNVSVAALRMNLPESEGGLGFNDKIIGFGFGLFFWGYWLLEIPSTVSVAKYGARQVFVRILILWGLCATLAGFIALPMMNTVFSWLAFFPDIDPASVWGVGHVCQWMNTLHENPEHQFYFLRFALGFFEGGFFPSVIVYLGFWFRAKDRGKAIASFMIAIPLSSAIGLPLSGLLLDAHMFGLQGWRWVFIIEGILPILAGVATLFFLPNRPKDAAWLPPDERQWLEGELHREHELVKAHSHWGFMRHFGMVMLLTLVYFGLNVSSYGLSSFMPAIIKSQLGLSDTWAAIVASLAFFMGFIAMMFNGWHSDKTQERPLHVGIPLFLLGCGLLVASMFDKLGWLAAIIMIVWVGTFMYSHLPAFWPIPTMFLGATAAASAIGFINMMGNLGGFFGPNMVGKSVADEISWVDKTVKKYVADPKLFGTPLSAKPGEKDAPSEQQRIEKFADTMADSGKLDETDVVHLRDLLGKVKAGQEMKQAERDELKQLMNKGASFSSALLRLAPWPIMSSLVILVVAYIRRRIPARE